MLKFKNEGERQALDSLAQDDEARLIQERSDPQHGKTHLKYAETRVHPHPFFSDSSLASYSENGYLPLKDCSGVRAEATSFSGSRRSPSR